MNHIRILLAVLLVFILHAAAISAPATSAKSTTTSQKNTDAWKTWKKGCDIYERGEALMLVGKYEEALARFTEALKYFNAVKEEKPQWSRKIIDTKIQLCQRKIDSMKKYQAMTPEERKNNGVPGETAPPSQTESDTAAIANLKKEIERCNTELQKYKDKLFAAVVEIENAQREIEREKRRTEQAHKAEDQIEGLLKEKNELEQNYILLNASYETLKKQKSSQTPSEKDNSAEVLAAEKQKYSQLAALCESLKKEASEYKERFAKAAAERTLLTETAKANEVKTQQIADALSRAEEKIKNARQSAEKSTADLLGMDREFKKASAKNKELSAEIERLNADLKKLRSNPDADSIVSQLNLENEKLKNDKAALQEKLESIFNEKNTISADMAKKTSELEKISNILATIEQERKKLKDKAEKNSADLAEKSNLISQNSAQLKTLTEENRNYKEKIEKLASEYNELRSKLETDGSTEKKESSILSKKVESLQSDIQNKDEAIKKATEDKDRAEKTVTELNQKIAELSQKLEDSIKKASDDSNLKSLIAEKNNALKKAVEEKGKAEKTVAELNQKLEDSLKKAANDSALKNAIAEKDSALKKAVEEKNNSDKTVAELNQKVTELNQKLKEKIIDNSNAVKMAQAVQNNENIQKLNSEIAKLSAENQKEKENAAAREKAMAANLDAAKKELVKKEQETAEILKKLQGIKKDISTATKQDSKEKQELSTSISELKQMNAKLEKELAEAKTDMVSRSELLQKDKAMSALIEELKRARETNSTLKLQLEEMKKSREAAASPETKADETVSQEKKSDSATVVKRLSGDKLGVERSTAAPTLTNGDNEKISYLVKTGLESEKQNDLKTALWHYKKALQIEPDNLKALKSTAHVAFRLKDYHLAGESARQALKKRSSDTDLIRIYAASSWKNGELEDASKAAEQLTQLSKNQADDYLLFAEISFQLKKLPAAEQAYKKTLELDPACGKAAMGLARIYSSDKNKLTEGMKYYRKALDLKEKADPDLEAIYPKNSADKKGQTRIIMIKKDSGETFFICDPILYGVSNPSVPAPAPVTATTHEKKKEVTVDLSTVPKADRPELDKAIYDFFISSAEAAEKKNEWPAAAWYYKKAAIFSKTSPDPLLKAAAILCTNLKMQGKALETYEQVLEDFKDEPRALAALGIIYYEQGKFAKALELLNTAVLLDPNNATIQRYQGLICLKLGNKNAAEKMLLKAFKTDPKNADIALDLARLYTLTFKTRLSDGAKWYRTAKILGAAPDKVLEGFFTTGNKEKTGKNK